MQEKKKRRRKKAPEIPWTLYILECNDRSFYTGVTNNLDRRLKAHGSGRASRFTRTRLPVRLVYSESCPGRTEALVRECAVKSLSRKAKEALVAGYVAP
ncbi:MAG: GIY-YIG nuclease family protein [Candidatus Omnitrophica bacterium]|nr:GIY-YIG nuclease family protein [Candidatus Omnitrophota bacterium]